VELAINEKAADLADIATVEVLDSRTVRIHLKQWNSGMLDTITNFLYIVSPFSYEQNGGKEWAYKHPVGTGPFKFVSWETDVSVKFEKFDQYWQEGKPHLDAVEWLIFQDPMTAAASMQVGEIDVFAFVTAQVLPELRDKANIVMLQSGLGAGQDGIITSSRDPNSPFHDVRVRKAVGHAIDVDAMLEAIMLGYAIPTNQWGTPNV
jgi:ABC-type transport system substrate-binding protein